MPLGATEDRVVGALDLERALTQGEKIVRARLAGAAHRGFLYIDEVNLLRVITLVDLLLDVAASGENVVEREGLSILIRAIRARAAAATRRGRPAAASCSICFGLSVQVRTPARLWPTRVQVVRPA